MIKTYPTQFLDSRPTLNGINIIKNVSRGGNGYSAQFLRRMRVKHVGTLRDRHATLTKSAALYTIKRKKKNQALRPEDTIGMQDETVTDTLLSRMQIILG